MYSEVSLIRTLGPLKVPDEQILYNYNYLYKYAEYAVEAAQKKDTFKKPSLPGKKKSQDGKSEFEEIGMNIKSQQFEHEYEDEEDLDQLFGNMILI